MANTFFATGITFNNNSEMVDFMKDFPCSIACGENANFKASIIRDPDGTYFLRLFSDNECGVTLNLGKKLTDGKKSEVIRHMEFFSNPDLRVYPRYNN